MLTALLFWVIVGIVAGFLANFVMRGGDGYGIVSNIIVGIIGALIGGFLMSRLIGLSPDSNIVYSIVVAFVNACLLFALLRVISASIRGIADDPSTYKSLPQSHRHYPSRPMAQPEPIQQPRPIYGPVEQLKPRYATPTLSFFISHSSKDDEFGLKLVHDLRRELGNDEAVWYDSEGGLYGGDSWWSRIVSVLEQCDVFIIIISPNSMNSKWVMKELDIATVEGKRIIPVLYQQANVRTDLRAIQYISFLDTVQYNVAFDRLMQALKR